MFGITGTGFNVAKMLTNDGKVNLLGLLMRSANRILICDDPVIASPIQLGSLGPDDDGQR